MKKVLLNLQHYSAYLAVFFLAFSLNSCSDDDDGILEPFEPTGVFEVEQQQIMVGNTLTLESITVEQDSWLVALPLDGISTFNFISDPVMLQEGINTDVQLTLDENAVENGDQIVLKIFGDDPNNGTMGEFDEADRDDPIAVTETITVFTEDSNEAAFSNFDEDNDGFLDRTETMNTFINDFDAWDIDDDGFLDEDEFFDTTFSITDANDDDFVDEDEFGLGFDSTFNSFIADDFSTFDADADGFLDVDEWNTAFADTEMFGTFDADDNTFIAEDEWNDGLFDTWDTDDDDFIGQAEFNLFNPFVGIW